MHTISLTLLIFLTLSGCANFNSIHRTSTKDDSKIDFIDAKQRAIWRVEKDREEITSKTVETTEDKLGAKIITKTITSKTAPSKTVICAEPSPDALAVISSNMGLTASKGDIEAAFNAAVSEGASTIGIRTTSIQLLRDAMYRACEAYASGAIEDKEYARLTKRYQKSMVTLLAIEQLTTSIYPPTVTLSSTSNSEYNKQVIEATKAKISTEDDLEKIETELVTASTELEAVKAEVSKAGKKVADLQITLPAPADQPVDGSCNNSSDKPKCDELKTAQEEQEKITAKSLETEKKKTQLDKEVKRTKDDLQLWVTALKQIKEPSRDTSVSASVTANESKVTAADVKHVANTISVMVNDVYRTDLIEVCFDTDIMSDIVKANEIVRVSKKIKYDDFVKATIGANERADRTESVAKTATQTYKDARDNYNTWANKIRSSPPPKDKYIAQNVQLELLGEKDKLILLEEEAVDARSIAKAARELADDALKSEIERRSEKNISQILIERINQQTTWCANVITKTENSKDLTEGNNDK